MAVSLVLVSPANAGSKPETNWQKANRIIRAVFPDSTENAALRVVACETGGTFSPWSFNRSSGASGYFQVLQGNAGRVLKYDKTWPGAEKEAGHMLIIPSGSRLFNPWLNARVALFLSHGGTNWGEWSCKP